MNSDRPIAGLRSDRDIDWMDSTYPLRHEWIQSAIDELAAGNADALARQAQQSTAMQQADLDRSGAFYARVTGPVDGYYIASHACRSNDRRGRAYVGAYKICEALPSSYWSAQALYYGSCKHTEGTGDLAMASAEAAAALKIADMPVRVDRL